jgi:hypothetical protein
MANPKGQGYKGKAVLIFSPNGDVLPAPSWNQAAAMLGHITRYITGDDEAYVNHHMIRESARFSTDKMTYHFPENTPLKGWKVAELDDDKLQWEIICKKMNLVKAVKVS